MQKQCPRPKGVAWPARKWMKNSPHDSCQRSLGLLSLEGLPLEKNCTERQGRESGASCKCPSCLLVLPPRRPSPNWRRPNSRHVRRERAKRAASPASLAVAGEWASASLGQPDNCLPLSSRTLELDYDKLARRRDPAERRGPLESSPGLSAADCLGRRGGIGPAGCIELCTLPAQVGRARSVQFTSFGVQQARAKDAPARRLHAQLDGPMHARPP